MTTRISWTDETWNVVSGCDRCSPGCDACYALTLAKRLKAMGQPHYQNDGDPKTSGPGFGVTCHPDFLDKPLRWRKPRRIFTCSMGDLFHPDVPEEFIAEVFGVMADCLNRHVFQVLTKRPQRMARLLRVDPELAERATPGMMADDGGWFAPVESPSGWRSVVLPNVWLGTSIESADYLWRLRHLRATLAAIRFVSAEPLLGRIPDIDLTGIDWCIIGGESGPHARPFDIEWARDIVAQCREAGVAPFVKQLGTQWAVANGHGRTNGDDPEQWPVDLRVQEFPAAVPA